MVSANSASSAASDYPPFSQHLLLGANQMEEVSELSARKGFEMNYAI